jgi:hypothetical protein
VPGPKDKERGIRQPFKMRFGIQVDGPIGIIKQRDPGAIPPNAFQNAVNVVRSGNRIMSRGGQSLLVSGMAGNINGMIETSSGDDAGGVGASVLFQATHSSAFWGSVGGLDRYNEDLSPAYSNFFPGTTPPNGVQYYNQAAEPDNPYKSLLAIDGTVYSINTGGLGGDNSFYKIVMPDRGLDPTTAQGRVSFQKLFAFPWVAGVVNVQSACFREERDANQPIDPSGQPSMSKMIYFGCDDGYVRRYDWRSLTIDSPLLPGASTPVTNLVLTYNDQIVCLGSGTTPDFNYFFVRSSAGVWTSYPMPAGITQRLHPHQGAVFNGIAYFACHDNGFNPLILAFDGTTVTIARNIASGSRVKMITVFAGLLTYFWEANSGNSVIGTYDGTTWTDSVDIIGTNFVPSWGCQVVAGNYLYYALSVSNTDTGGTARLGVVYRSASLALTPRTLIKIIDTDPSFALVANPYTPLDAVAVP